MKMSNRLIGCILFVSLLWVKPEAAQSASGSNNVEAKEQSTSAAPEFKGDKEKVSYALGMRMALELKVLRKNVEIDPEMVAQGLRDALSGSKTRLTDDERTTILVHLQKDLEMKELALRQEMAEKNKNDSDAFLAANKAKEGVVTLASGLQYKILTQGTGPTPTANDIVICNYRGTFLNGQEFDSSYKRGQPSTFRVMGVIPGWSEALQLMPVGSKWQIFVPPDLAYGGEGHGKDIQPNSALIFEVELLRIQEKNSPAK